MDHAINAVNEFFEISIERLYEEWKTGEFKKLSDCPTYEESSTYKKAIGIMEKYYYRGNGEEISLKEHIENHIWCTQGVKVEW
ncbi:hypothetical protein FC694_22500 [Bacillus wiedmannii]|uniref:Uncharacterized protein n=1 Tax=Bacillus wiedmannii TaxID=1890302 RepID=A0A4U2MME5_9BACI|nr:hypothetical protein [Bacillus wiedmannii]TKH12188.1 hypothetical protein FC694_22500 [Bacillus wiedmannii]